MMDTAASFNYRLIVAPIFVILSFSGLVFSLYILYVANTAYLLFMGIGFTVLSFISMIFGIMSAIWYYKSFNYDRYIEHLKKQLRPMKTLPTVSVVMPTHDEDIGMIKDNVRELKMLNYPKERMHIFVLNDSSDPNRRSSIESACNGLRVGFIGRENNRAYKAGALNDFLKRTGDEFIAIFDADERLTDRNFLLDLLPFFQDKNIAYVQTEKRYANGNFLSEAINVFDLIFYRFIQTARALNKTAIFAGSCGIIRKRVLDEMGGFPEYVVEDTFFSFETKCMGYENVYVPKVYALGKPIMSFTEFAKQQWRYNYGGTQFFAYFMKKRKFTKRSLISNLDYITHGFGLNYISIVLILYALFSIGIIFSTLPIVHTNFLLAGSSNVILGLELLGLISFGLSLLTPVLLSKIYFGSWSKGFMVFLLNYALAIVRTKAAIASLISNSTISGWKLSISTAKGKLLGSILNTKTEVVFAVVFVAFAVFSYNRVNSAGSLLIGFYAIMFLLTTVFLYKYG